MVGKRRLFPLVFFLAFALIVAACNGDDDDVETDVSETTPVAETDDTTPEETEVVEEEPTAEPEPTPEPEPTEEPTAIAEDDDDADIETDVDVILDRAAERASELNSARFDLDGTGSIEIEEIGEISLSNATGVVDRSTGVEIEFDIDLAGMEVPLGLVAIDEGVYFRDVFTGTWQSAPEDFQFNPRVIFDDDNGIPALIRSIENPELEGTAELDGRDVYHVTGMVSQETIQAGTSGIFQAEDDVVFEVWIDQETHDVLLIRAEDPTNETDSVWEMRIFDHDEPVEIETPSDD